MYNPESLVCFEKPIFIFPSCISEVDQAAAAPLWPVLCLGPPATFYHCQALLLLSGTGSPLSGALPICEGT